MEEAAESSEMSPHFYKTARRHIYKQAVLVFTAIRNIIMSFTTHNYFHNASIYSRTNMSTIIIIIIIIITIIIINGCKMDKNVIVHKKRDQESKNTGFGKAEINKHPCAEGVQHTGRNKLKEDLQLMWHKVRLLQMCEREKLPKLTSNSKFIKLQEEIWSN